MTLTHANLIVGEIDKCKLTIVKYLLEMDSGLDLYTGLRENGYVLGEQKESMAMAVLENLLKKSNELGPVGTILVPSRSLKKIKNSIAFLKNLKNKLALKIYLPIQDTESILGYLAVKIKFEIPEQELMIWNMGLTRSTWTIRSPEGKFEVYTDKLNPLIFKNMVIEGIEEKDHLKIQSPNPLGIKVAKKSQDMLDTYLKFSLNQDLVKNSKNYKVVGIGNFHNKSIAVLTETKTDIYHYDEVDTTLDSKVDLSDSQIGGENPSEQITNLILAKGYMKRLKIKNVFLTTLNEAYGAVLYPEYWTTP
jgi:exopolyphosphatase/guanosine-5'-triphosphate,3'-diphosphate pyrophosphatase